MIDSAETLKNPRVAIMQPYFLPYIGYFQLICASDVFVFYDDVHFIKKGWLRRNRIWSNSQELLISLPCKGASQNKLINEVLVDTSHASFQGIRTSIEHAYRKSPQWQHVSQLLDDIFHERVCSISEFNERSIKAVMDYLGMPLNAVKSSELAPETRGMPRAERLIAISKKLNGTTYINMPGGKALYEPKIFESASVALKFLKPRIPNHTAPQAKGRAMNMSIIDAIMHYPPAEINVHLNNFEYD